MAAVNLRVLGGAIGRIPAADTAFAHRNGRIMANVAALGFSPDGFAARETWASDFADALRDGDCAADANSVEDQGPQRVRDAYPPATWNRLAAVKRRYDPTNLPRQPQHRAGGSGG